MNKVSRQQQIADAARKLIFKYGSKHLTVRRIAKEVGVTEGAIYRHFPSKNSIMTFLADHIADNLLGDISKARDKAGNRLEILHLTMKNHFSAIEQRRGLSFQVIAEIITQGDKHLNKKLAGIIDNYINVLRDLFEQAVASGEMRNNIDLHVATQLLFGMIQGLVTIWTLNNRNFNLVERYEELWKLFLRIIIEKTNHSDN